MKFIKKYHSTSKIIEIYKKYIKFSKCKKKYILILGSGKGVWEKYLSIYKKFQIFSVDCLYNANLSNFFIRTDIFKKNFFFDLCLFKKKFDIIICDICCNLSGIKEKDYSFFLKLFYKLSKVYKKFLKKNGILIFKFINYCNIVKKFYVLKKDFINVKFVKLISSKKNSSEFYSICKYFK
ncbi:Ribosomal RNA large subunit methyltransferase E [Candidatus Vidania fulgoroideae]|uniref:Ribosomal RNA large subunit methyltransferase E n=1 Tax=Candidatus Vidania fulgoroideorum TaxID=881286 RepID=A0A346E0H1_9PROT|nr:Ribosomal RNA large subunit methyltransferase E [Candidatus Vidania fulgoroideae]